MNKEEAIDVIYKVINSGIIKDDLESQLRKVVLHIKNDNWKPVPTKDGLEDFLMIGLI